MELHLLENRGEVSEMIMAGGSPVEVRLSPELVDGPSVISRLNASDGLVSAHVVDGILVIRPRRQPTMAGMPAYYNGRPEFRGALRAESHGPLILKGSVRRSDLPTLFMLLGGVLAVLGATTGAAIVLGGDPTGALLIIISALCGVGVVAGAVLIGRLSVEDERSIIKAIRAITNEEPVRPSKTPQA